MTLDIAHNIKLVIWDMDETFWHGTLSEESVSVKDENVSIIHHLTSRGIINSICSKNDCDSVMKELKKMGVWEYFVFNKISWDPKGPQIKSIIKDMNLRACNVLFIDDNKSNLEEAKFYNKGIYTLTPDKISYMLTHPMIQGNDDLERSRLNQYKILERKKTIKNNLKISNEEFLQSSGIRVNVSDFEYSHLERVADLVERSNQLNFTKLRSSKDNLHKLIDSDNIETGVVHVDDNFGSYGLCGFYVVKNKKLIHFVFSCRIMGMGIESWCYHYLGRPELVIDGDVSVKLMTVSPPWIQEIDIFDGQVKTLRPSTSARVLLTGGCDLQQVGDMLEKYFSLETEFNYMKDGVNVRKDHTELILAELNSEVEEAIKKIPFLSNESVGSKMFSKEFNAIVISPLMDFHQGCYKNKYNKVIIPKDSFEIDLTIIDMLDTKRIKKYGKDFLEWFSRNYEFIGPLSPEKFKSNITQIKSKLPKNCILFCLTAAEIDYKYPDEDFTYSGKVSQHYDRHCKMNSVLEDLNDDGILELIDVRSFVCHEDDLEASNIYHYTRKNYNKLATLVKEHVMNKLLLQKNIKRPKNKFLKLLRQSLKGVITRSKNLFRI